MKSSSRPTHDALMAFLQKLDVDAEAHGYPHGLISKMGDDPTMRDILIRMIGAELEAIKEINKQDKQKTQRFLNSPIKK
jgi:hypothetical protein